MISFKDLSSYEVQVPRATRRVLKSRIFEIPLEDPIVHCLPDLVFSYWLMELLASPDDAYAKRCAIDGNGSCSEAIVSRALLKWAPVTVLLCDSQVWCGIAPPSTISSHQGVHFIKERLLPSHNRCLLRQLGFSVADELSGLLSMLHGYRSSQFPPCELVSSVLSCEDVFDQEIMNNDYSGCDLAANWDPCISMMSSLGGDRLLVSKTGVGGWWRAGSSTAITPSFASLLALASALDRYWTRKEGGLLSAQTEPEMVFDPDFPNDE